ncbi:hypothetical protein SSBR45G_19090 [Bradyrhizobium sp. SSBR45G]|uniref:hypothetical protein n=1 Tax=unclassified Bradyrhizobium TaxID=2631580 RepID=UPI002342AA2A|nr:MULTISPECIES: hypothetical protein [unclassified Bradyrhizobium]GLH77001.1 hypothetical protein SSBR45G_19090 [Bradyrhizobium sp. SSBR45G]GLH83759.1 hypothetical protein SSBR45R_12190 [Bradyrhizobium sp. SSBR45R]
MALIGRLIVIAFAFLVACFVAGLVVVTAILFPELSNLGNGPIDQTAFEVIIGFGFIFVSGFALIPALLIALITETFSIRSVLAYAIGGGVVGAACYLGLIPFDPDTFRFDGIDRRQLEILTGAGILGGLIYWLIAGRNAGRWREPARLLPPPPPLPSGSPR